MRIMDWSAGVCSSDLNNITSLPLSFLARTTACREYALSRALSIMTAPLKRHQRSVLRRTFTAWSSVSSVHTRPSEQAIRTLVLAHVLNDLVQVRAIIYLRHPNTCN